MDCPVRKGALQAKNKIVSAISSGVAARLTGTVSRKSALPSPPPVSSAGIIDGDIEPPETLDDLIYQAPHFLVMANIGADEFGLCAKRAELFHQICARIAVPTRDDDLIAFVGEGQGRRAADPGERAGNQDNSHLVSRMRQRPRRRQVARVANEAARVGLTDERR
jgi:hypothetical protein